MCRYTLLKKSQRRGVCDSHGDGHRGVRSRGRSRKEVGCVRTDKEGDRDIKFWLCSAVSKYSALWDGTV
jgi:hypothetical protein